MKRIRDIGIPTARGARGSRPLIGCWLDRVDASTDTPKTGPLRLGEVVVEPHTKVWAAKIGSFDGYVFVTPEYNHGISGALVRRSASTAG